MYRALNRHDAEHPERLQKPASRTVLATIDVIKPSILSVPCQVLTHKMFHTSIPTHYQNWLGNYLAERKPLIFYGNVSFHIYPQQNSAPQVLFYPINILTFKRPANVLIASYADDLIMHPTAAQQLQGYLAELKL